MSDMEAIHLKVVQCSQDECLEHQKKTNAMDELDISDYYAEHSLIHIDSVLWKYVKKEQLDPCGFTHVLNKTSTECEMIVYFYNGGTHEDEIVKEAVENDCF